MSNETNTPHDLGVPSDAAADKQAKLAEELKSMAETGKEQQKRDEAFSKYADYQSEYYKKANLERVEKANTPGVQKIKVDTYDDGAVTMVAQINTDKIVDPNSGKVQEGKVIDGHDYNPDAQTFREIEVQWQHYLATTSSEERLVIYEGPPMDEQFFNSRESSIQGSRRGDSGYLQWLARASATEAISGEVDNKAQLEKFEKAGVSRDEAVLFFTLRSMAAAYNNQPVPADIAMNFHFQLAELDTPGFKVFSEEEKQNLIDHPELLIAEKEKVLPYVEKLNKTPRASGQPELVIKDNGDIGFAREVTNNEVGKWIGAEGNTRLGEIGRLNIAGRDEGIFEVIADATKAGKKPFIVFGGSHVVSLEPVLQQYYGKMESN